MNDFEYIYMKQRKDFGRYCQFDEVEPKIIGVVERNIDCLNDFVEQTVINVVLDNIPVMSEHSVNTARDQVRLAPAIDVLLPSHRQSMFLRVAIRSGPP